MSLASKLLSVSGSAGGADKLYVDDVFQARTRTGTGSATYVDSGVDLSKGYMVWSKGRSGATDHAVYDSARGVTLDLVSNSTAAQTTQATGLNDIYLNSYGVGSLAKMNTSGATYVDFVFRKAPKFFDVVTWTGNGGLASIPHSLGVAPGMIIVKATSALSNWGVWHSRDGNAGAAISGISLNSTNAALYISENQYATSTTFQTNMVTDHTGTALNVNGVTYVAYLFAHDTSADGIIQCGSFTTDASGNATVNLGWEPQYWMVKGSSTASSWRMMDASRGFPVSSGGKYLFTNDSGAEGADGSQYLYPTSTGFVVTNSAFPASSTQIYLAIRRPNKPPTLGTQVYNAIARTGTGAAATISGVGFAPDLVMAQSRNQAGITSGASTGTRLQGVAYLRTQITNAEVSSPSTSLSSWQGDGISIAGNASDFNDSSLNTTYINHFFKRAVGVFDEVCYTGTGVAKTEAHGLGVVPELIIVKSRSAAGHNWNTWTTGFVISSSSNEYVVLNSTDPRGDKGAPEFWGSSYPSPTVFGLGTNLQVNASATTYVAYMFASKAGISKVGSYTGNGTTQYISCGFTTGARFILVKKTSGVGDWLVADTVRGIVAAGDPRLSLNTTAAEITGEDWCDPDVYGFAINQTTADANASGASYIFLAIA